MDVIDPHKTRLRFEAWKQKPIIGISKTNATLLKNFISDMEIGLNTNGTKKGARSPVRLLSNISRVKRVMELLETHYKITDIRKVQEKQLHDLFHKLEDGIITKANGKPYGSVPDFIKRFKVFWRWHIKTNRKKGISIPNLTDDLSAETKTKPPFVYFTNEQLETMMKEADYDTRALMIFLYDTGLRPPKEAFNIRVNDFTDDYTQLNIRDEIAKTFGRKIRLMMCSKIIKEYVKDNHLKDTDPLFTLNPYTINKRLKNIGKKVLGTKPTLGRKRGDELTMYDFRHSSTCYWLPRYKSRNAILYRFGWTKEEQLIYYSGLLGMRDEITEEDMLLDTTRTELEKRQLKIEREVKELKKIIKQLLPEK